MAFQAFKYHDLLTVSEALDIAEDATGDYYKFSTGQWKRHRYEVKTLLSLNDEKEGRNAFASLKKGEWVCPKSEKKYCKYDFYLICLQDHLILNALRRDNQLALLPLLVYVFTHELVHIVRFCNFFQRFEASESKKGSEERLVHATTFEILRKLSLPKLNYVLDSYMSHRIGEILAS